MKTNHHKLLFAGVLISIVLFCRANLIQWNEVRSLKDNINYMRNGQYQQLIQKLAKKKSNINYAEAFMLGKAHFSLKEYQKSALWFARSVFYKKNRPRKNSAAFLYRYLNTWSNVFEKYSPIKTEALYHVALCHYQKKAYHDTIRFLDIMEEHLTDETKEKYWALKAKVYNSNSERRALFIYEKLIRQYKKSIYYIGMASIYKRKKEYSKAVDIYFEALEFTDALWSTKIILKEIIQLIQKNPSLKNKLNIRKKIFLAEGYRIIKKHSQANKAWSNIKFTSLTSKDKILYTKLYARFLFTKRNYKKAVFFVKKHSKTFKLEQREKIMYELSKKLLQIDQYQEILKLVPPYLNSSKLTLHRMQALRKLKVDTREKEAGYYLQNNDADSTISERTYFSSCLEKMIEHKINQAISCLTHLASYTKSVSTGGRSRYFLAKLAEKKKITTFKKRESMNNHLRAKYAEVYLNSPSDVYTFKALKKSLGTSLINGVIAKQQLLPKNDIKKIRHWLAYQAGDPKSLKKFLVNKKQDPMYAVDSFWKKWENDLQNLDYANSKIKKAILFIAMGFNDLVRPYIQGIPIVDRLMIYQKAGHLINDAYLKYTHLKAYTIKKKKSVDIFTLSKKAQESLYPMPYLKYIREASERFNIKKERLYALMKQESAFHPGLRSSVGATGVMQIMPSTAKWLNKKLKIKEMHLTNPRHSILLGAKFCADVTKRYSDNFEEIAIAYNAGPQRLIKWKKTISTDDHDLFLEQIPFRETNLYVKKTKAYYERYKILTLTH